MMGDLPKWIRGRMASFLWVTYPGGRMASLPKLATDYPLLFVSNGFSIATKSATNKSVAKKSATTNLHPIFAVVDSIAKLF